jgi:hypothetical protein
MQMQSIVVASPSGADLIGLFEQNRAQSVALQPLRGGEARRAGADNHCFRQHRAHRPPRKTQRTHQTSIQLSSIFKAFRSMPIQLS